MKKLLIFIFLTSLFSTFEIKAEEELIAFWEINKVGRSTNQLYDISANAVLGFINNDLYFIFNPNNETQSSFKSKLNDFKLESSTESSYRFNAKFDGENNDAITFEIPASASNKSMITIFEDGSNFVVSGKLTDVDEIASDLFIFNMLILADMVQQKYKATGKTMAESYDIFRKEVLTRILQELDKAPDQ